MANEFTTQEDFSRRLGGAADSLRAAVAAYADLISSNPSLAESLGRQFRLLTTSIEEAARNAPIPPDGGLAGLIGVGDGSVPELGDSRRAPAITPYDDTVASERLQGAADLYYIYQHERMGLFTAVLKLQELFQSGQVRLSSGDGAFALYRYDRQKVLRSTRRERFQAYRRVFGYTQVAPPPGSRPNVRYHPLFTNFNRQVARFHRDQRIAEVIRNGRDDSTFGSVAVVRRAGLDLRSNLKQASYGNVNVLRTELYQLLERAYFILQADDVRRLFGADNAWETLEEVSRRYLKREAMASQRNRMATTGREILRWLAEPNILTVDRAQFEGLLLTIAGHTEEWLTSAESLGLGRPRRRERGAMLA